MKHVYIYIERERDVYVYVVDTGFLYPMIGLVVPS